MSNAKKFSRVIRVEKVEGSTRHGGPPPLTSARHPAVPPPLAIQKRNAELGRRARLAFAALASAVALIEKQRAASTAQRLEHALEKGRAYVAEQSATFGADMSSAVHAKRSAEKANREVAEVAEARARLAQPLNLVDDLSAGVAQRRADRALIAQAELDAASEKRHQDALAKRGQAWEDPSEIVARRVLARRGTVGSRDL